MGIEPCNARNVARAQQRQQAVKLYASNAPRLARGSGRLCPECRMRETERGHQRCYACQEKRRKDSKRDSMRKTRSHVDIPCPISAVTTDT
jgi:hypothetical protein